MGPQLSRQLLSRYGDLHNVLHVARMALHQPYSHNSTHGLLETHDASPAAKSVPTRGSGLESQYFVTPATVASIAYLKYAAKQLGWPVGPLTTKAMLNNIDKLRKARNLTR